MPLSNIENATSTFCTFSGHISYCATYSDYCSYLAKLHGIERDIQRPRTSDFRETMADSRRESRTACRDMWRDLKEMCGEFTERYTSFPFPNGIEKFGQFCKHSIFLVSHNGNVIVSRQCSNLGSNHPRLVSFVRSILLQIFR